MEDQAKELNLTIFFLFYLFTSLFTLELSSRDKGGRPWHYLFVHKYTFLATLSSSVTYVGENVTRKNKDKSIQ